MEKQSYFQQASCRRESHKWQWENKPFLNTMTAHEEMGIPWA